MRWGQRQAGIRWGPISRELVRLLIGGGALRILMFSLYTTVLALAILSMENALIFFKFISIFFKFIYKHFLVKFCFVFPNNPLVCSLVLSIKNVNEI